MKFSVRIRKQGISAHLSAWALTYSEKEYHAEHRKQSRNDYTEEGGEFPRLSLLGSPPPGAARALIRGLPSRLWPQLGLIDAGREAVVEERSPFCHGETCSRLSSKTS